VRNFLRPLNGVLKKYLAGYLALCQRHRNYKRIRPTLISPPSLALSMEEPQ
jgi:transposase-like protein